MGYVTSPALVNADGTATIYAVTSTVSGNGDQGADPNKAVVINDQLSATQVAANEGFTVFTSAGYVRWNTLRLPSCLRDTLGR
jgi:hypothetical protein